MSYECRLHQERYLFCSASEPGAAFFTRAYSSSFTEWACGMSGAWLKKCLGCLEISEILLYYAITSVKESRTMPGLSESGFAQEKFAKSDFFAYICNSKRDKRNYYE